MALGRQLFLFLPLSLALAASAAEIERHKVEIVDKFGVNMASGQVQHSFPMVSIGGAMGLTYSISIYANENWGQTPGFSTNFSGRVRDVLLSTEVNYTPWYVMRASDDSGSADFKVVVNGVVQSTFANLPLPYEYVPVGDQRHSLEVVGNTLEWTKPDGTVVTFSRGGSNAGNWGSVSHTTYPNGFTVRGMTTNTGYQLRGFYVPDNRPFDKVDNPNLWNVPPASSSGWAAANPKHIVAINNAIEACPAAPAECSLTHSWPTATFDWPAGMPRTLFIGDSVVTITRADGASADIRYRAYDLAYNQYGQVAEGYTPGREFSPRMVGLRPFGATRESYTYDYNNLFVSGGSPNGLWNRRLQTSGVIKSATHIQKVAAYSMLQNASVGGNDYRNNANQDGDVPAVYIQPKIFMGNPDMIGWADTREGRITFEHAHGRNFPREFNRVSRPLERYSYDTRGNLTKIEYQIGSSFVTHVEAEYPASCTPSTRKTCNQATWIADAKGNRTYYGYHPQSGQVASITSPPDKNGRSAMTRYEYTPLSASYFDPLGSGTRITGSPIYMKTAERYCINSNYSGGCQGGDEVVTRFEYNHDNLLMTGMTVTADGTTLRTCYQYDRFGNQIGKTTPNANRATCN